MSLIDTHCHLDFPELYRDLDQILARAEKAGVSRMISICTKLEDFPRIRTIAESHAPVFCAVGVHPHEASRYPSLTARELVALADGAKTIAIGETGLDDHYTHSPMEAQETSFRLHIEAARQTGLPLIVHSRSADDATIRILEEEYQKGAFSGLLHCFSAGEGLARAALEIGFYVSFSGILTFKKAENVRKVAEFCPSQRLLVETDAPFLAPEPHRGKRNEPAFVCHTAARLADLRGISHDALAQITTENARCLFSKIA